ncbi:hypothetical protein FWC63_02305 [Candidatus Saccharibacteria bacterium]|nr:hypothetical protein [Candidatus Saccharibacteria bacterium]
MGSNTVRAIQRITGATLLVSGFLVFAGILTDVIRPTHAQEEIGIEPMSGGSLSLTTSNAGPCSTFNHNSGELNLDVVISNIASGCITVSVSTDGAEGYTLGIEGPPAGQLTSSGVRPIDPTNGTIAAPATFTNLADRGAWGFAIPSGQISGVINDFNATYQVSNSLANTSRFAALPTDTTPISITDTANTTPNNYNIFFAVSAGTYMPTGNFTGEVTISASINIIPPPLILMQEITHLNCPTERTMAVDARDNRTYWVQRMPDGMCWMLTNLAYGGGGNNTFNDAVDWLQEGLQNNIGAALFARPPGANPTTFPQAPSTAIDGGVALAGRQFGYLYNWCAAMGDQGDACQDSNSWQPDQAMSICPAGWRLPTGEPTTGEFALLNNAVNNGATGTDAGLRTNWLGQYGGQFWNGNFFPGIGHYWSSTVFGSVGARSLVFEADVVAPATSSDQKASGNAVRCVADVPQPNPSILMQNITLSSCPTTRTMAVDARDNRTYWIRRIPSTRQGGGDLCWMETNLAYAGGGDNQFGDVRMLTQGVIGTNTAAGQVCHGDNASFSNHGEGCVWRPAAANPTTFPNAPSISTDGGVTNPQFGYLYNWCAAMGNQPDACQSMQTDQPDQNINVCPAGWRLPTGGVGGEFALLNNAVNGGSTNPAGLLFNWLGTRGDIFVYGMYGAGIGNFWSSTAAGWNSSFGSMAHFLVLSNMVNSVTMDSVSYGLSVRCVRD